VEGELADIYGGMARMGIDARRADGMELFEIGCAFGLNRPDEETEAVAPVEEWDPIKARVEARAKGLPEPTAPPPKAQRKRQTG
jgi:hypothetical protein